jgi:hypothetical protein
MQKQVKTQKTRLMQVSVFKLHINKLSSHFDLSLTPAQTLKITEPLILLGICVFDPVFSSQLNGGQPQ